MFDPQDTNSTNSFFAFGGGTIGGEIWDWSSGMPRIKEEFKSRVAVLPSGSSSRQELRYLREQAERSGKSWVEAPVQYSMTQSEKYGAGPAAYKDPQGNKFSATIIDGSSSWGGHGAGAGEYEKRVAQKSAQRVGATRQQSEEQNGGTQWQSSSPYSMGQSSQDAMAFTTFGQGRGINPAQTPEMAQTFPPYEPRSGSSMAFTPFGESMARQVSDQKESNSFYSGIGVPFFGQSMNGSNFKTAVSFPLQRTQMTQYGSYGAIPRFPYSEL